MLARSACHVTVWLRIHDNVPGLPQAVLRTERDLADADSLFRSIDGVEVHFKRTVRPSRSASSESATAETTAHDAASSAAGPQPLGIACYHGFGVRLRAPFCAADAEHEWHQDHPLP